MTGVVGFYKNPRKDGSKKDDWETPSWIIDLLKQECKINFDLCASDENHKCELYFSEGNSCLTNAWPMQYTYFMNPPFSKAKIFFEKVAEEAKNGKKIVCIYKAANLETKLWQDVILPNAQVLFLKKRVNYVTDGKPSKGVTFGSALIFFNVEPTESLTSLGTVVIKKG